MVLPRNEFIDWLAKDPNWGASDDQKRPLYFGDFLKTNNPQDISMATLDKLDKLPTLDEMDAHPSLFEVNRAYRLHASDNLVVSFDIEPASHPSYLAHYAAMPAHYSEYSRNNGIHLYYRIRRNRLSPDALNLILQTTVYKYPNKIDTLQTPVPFIYELILNNHWVTFTEKVITDHVLPLHEDAPDEIYHMIEHAATINKQRIDLSDANLSVELESTELSQKLANLIRENKKKMVELAELTPMDYEDDTSRYEFACASKICFMLSNRLANPKAFDAMFLEVDLENIDYADKINAVLEVLVEVIPEREKHVKHRINGVPYLLYITQKAWYGMEELKKQSS